MNLMLDHAKVEDLSAVLALMSESGLPGEGLAAHLSTTLVARIDGRIVGCSALELYGKYALLRSVAVDPSFRSRGLGLKLVRAALDLAERQRVAFVYLLSETACEFFYKLGFETVQRSSVPQTVMSSVEFSKLCPASAKVMVLSLQ